MSILGEDTSNLSKQITIKNYPAKLFYLLLLCKSMEFGIDNITRLHGLVGILIYISFPTPYKPAYYIILIVPMLSQPCDIISYL